MYGFLLHFFTSLHFKVVHSISLPECVGRHYHKTKLYMHAGTCRTIRKRKSWSTGTDEITVEVFYYYQIRSLFMIIVERSCGRCFAAFALLKCMFVHNKEEHSPDQLNLLFGG